MKPIAMTQENEDEARLVASRRARWEEGVRLRHLLAEIEALRDRLQKAEKALAVHGIELSYEP